MMLSFGLINCPLIKTTKFRNSQSSQSSSKAGAKRFGSCLRRATLSAYTPAGLARTGRYPLLSLTGQYS
jgi:hypothetical protein